MPTHIGQQYIYISMFFGAHLGEWNEEREEQTRRMETMQKSRVRTPQLKKYSVKLKV